jgi:hypothetical protein
MSPVVWIVTECHCYPPHEGQLSVWMSGKPLSPDKELAEDCAEKLIGPVDAGVAERFVESFRRQLELAGVTVVSEYAADD